MTEDVAGTFEPAAREALAAFGVEAADLRFVNVSENVTFRATDARDGSAFGLRLHRPGYHDIAALRSEHMWTRALVRAGIAAPEPLPTLDGAAFAEVFVAGTGEWRWAGLARWVEGELLGDVVSRDPDPAANAGRFASMGALMAALHDHATGWTPPADFARHSLDADGLMGPEPRWGQFWEHEILSPAERALLRETRVVLHGALRRYGTPARKFSLIHADLHPRNVVTDGARIAAIDFDDCGFGWHLYDLAVALVAYQDHPDFFAFRDACVSGYRSVRALSDAERALLPMFLLIRDLAQLGWLHQRPELPRAAMTRQITARILAAAARFEAPV